MHKMTLKGRKQLRKQHLQKSSKDRIIELVVEMDKIHTENNGRISVDEMRLRVKLRINLSHMALANKLKIIKKIFHEKFLKWIFDYLSP